MLTFTVKYMRNGVIRRKFTVPASSQVLHGVYCNGVPYLPDLDAVKACMDKRLHPAIDRNIGFWTDKYSDEVSMELHGASRTYYKQGKPLGTLFAQADWKATACKLDGYQHGLLDACAVRISGKRYQIASNCGKVSIQVNTTLAESRIAQARDHNTTPVFMYS